MDAEIRVVLAATDFTPTSYVAARRAAEICASRSARMHLMHVFRRSGLGAKAWPSAVGGQDRLTAAAASAHLRRASAHIATEFGIEVETHFALGQFTKQIATRARALDADLLVLGNSKGGLLAEMLGLNAALRVQSHTDLPVRAVSNGDLQRYARLLLPVDLSPEGAHAARRALRFFPGAASVLLHAFDTPYSGMRGTSDIKPEVLRDYEASAIREGLARLQVFAREEALRDALLRVDLGHPALAARMEARLLGADLIVVRPTRHWLTSSVTEHLVADPPCDLLLMP